MKEIRQKEPVFQWILLGLLIIAIFTPNILVQVYIHNHEANDFIDHILYAGLLLENPGDIPPHIQAHPLFQASVVTVQKIISFPLKLLRLKSIPIQAAGTITTITFYVLLGCVLYKEIHLRLKSSRYNAVGWAISFTLFLMLVAPIPLVYLLDRQLYFGYIGINIYHNPTQVVLKPLALLCFWYALKTFTKQSITWTDILLSALLNILSALAKPSFLICLLPALGIMTSRQLFYKYRTVANPQKSIAPGLQIKPPGQETIISWPMILLGVILPSGAVLFLQYLATYNTDQAGIIFDPLGPMSAASSYLLPKFLLSILFPLCMSLIYRKEVRKDTRMIFAWFLFFFGAFYTYFLAETGERYTHLNFGWGAEITLFILFVSSALFWIEQMKNTQNRLTRSQILLWSVSGLHLVSGVIYYLYTIFVNFIS